MRIDDENYVTVRERQRNALEKQLDKVLKQYSITKISDIKGAMHGKDYREMKQLILDSIYGNNKI
jgi:hypothetical protein